MGGRNLNMTGKNYSANSVKLSFWFLEYRKVMSLITEGMNLKEIRELNRNENIFAAPTFVRGDQIFLTISKRVSSLNNNINILFEKSDVSTQKIINLIAILETDTLFFDFMYEVYREKLILGSNTLEESDIRIFFKNKQMESEKVAKWQDYTLHRLGGVYKTMLSETGLIEKNDNHYELKKPMIDIMLERYLIENNLGVYLKIFSGVR